MPIAAALTKDSLISWIRARGYPHPAHASAAKAR